MKDNVRKSNIVAAATMAFLQDLRLRGLDTFEILSALCLSVVRSAKSLGIPKSVILNVINKLWEGLEEPDPDKPFIIEADIEA